MNNVAINECTPSLTIVVPCYNEAESFLFCYTELDLLLKNLIQKNKISEESCILFIDDGSKDNTWELIRQAHSQNSNVKGLKLSRNKGHQTALMAGLSKVNTDICISIDADLQDDISCIEDMVEKYSEGYHIVYGVRNNRDSDTKFKRMTANSFYSLLSLMGVNQIPNHADYRLLSRIALDSLLQYREQNIYIRGLIPLLGYPSTEVFYSRAKRIAGESKYPLKKMLSLAIDGITSLSVTPLRLISMLGFITCLLSILMMIWGLVAKLSGTSVSGWTSVIIAISFFSGVQLLSLGVIGEYIGKIYLESKCRPKFFIESFLE